MSKARAKRVLEPAPWYGPDLASQVNTKPPPKRRSKPQPGCDLRKRYGDDYYKKLSAKANQAQRSKPKPKAIKPAILSLKMHLDLIKRLDKHARAAGETRSEYIRRAVRARMGE